MTSYITDSDLKQLGQLDMPPYLKGVGQPFLNVFDRAWWKAWEDHPPSKSAVLLTICSHAKPYSKSYIHGVLRNYLYHAGLLDKLDYAHISNAGIVPSAAENDHPFCAYDWDDRDCRPEDRLAHVGKTTDRLYNWYKEYGRSYPGGIFIYLREDGHTIKGALAAQKALKPYKAFTIIAGSADAEPLPFMRESDRDDCLTTPANLDRLITAMRDKGL